MAKKCRRECSLARHFFRRSAFSSLPAALLHKDSNITNTEDEKLVRFPDKQEKSVLKLTPSTNKTESK